MTGGSQARMRAPRAVVAVVVALWVVATVAVLGGMVLLVYPGGPMPPHGFGSPAGDAMVALAYAAGAAVGALIVLRRPELPLGWIMLAAGFFSSTASGASEYYTLARNHGLPLPGFAAWYGAWAWELGAGLAVSFALLLFPTGRLPSRRWVPVALVSAVLLLALVLGQALAPGTFSGEFQLVRNPIGLEDARWLRDVRDFAWGFLFILLGLSGVSLVARYRTAGTVERAQLKWFAFSASLIAVALVARSPMVDENSLVAQVPLVIGVVSFPVVFGVAVLRYRLFDINRVVSRTVSYSLLTLVLLGVYVVAALVVARTLAPVDPDSNVSVALATLVAAGAFRPARSRIQAAVDRRFNRSRFDGERAAEAFRRRLRAEHGLEEVVAELLSSVDRTLQPAAASVWLPASRPVPAQRGQAPTSG